MIPYVVLLSIPGICMILENRYTLMSAKKRHEKKTFGLSVFFILFFFMLALRSQKTGVDLQNYFDIYRQSVSTFFGKLIYGSKTDSVELGYVALNKLVGYINEDFQFFIVIVALICVIPAMLFYRKEMEMPFLTMVLFCTVAPFSMYFSGLRQAIAMTFVFPAYILTRNRKKVLFVVTVICATLFHISALLMFIIYPVYHIKMKPKWLIFAVPVFIAGFVFRENIFRFLMNYLPARYQTRYGEITQTNAYGFFILLLLLSIYTWVIPGSTQLGDDLVGLRNLLMVATCIQSFASLHVIAMRYNFYFLLLIPILIPKIANRAAAQYKQIAQLSVFVLAIMLIIYFYANLFFGKDILWLYPYIPFWEG